MSNKGQLLQDPFLNTLRREHGLSASETHRAIEEQLEALLAR